MITNPSLLLCLCLASAPERAEQPVAEPLGFIALGDLPGGVFYSSANAISADGRTIVGTATVTEGSHAFRWTAATGMISLGDLPGGVVASYATGVSANGSVVIGAGSSGHPQNPVLQAFRWTQNGGLQGLNDRPGGLFRCWASGVSADGSIIVGVGIGSMGTEAIYWTPGSLNPFGLGDLEGGAFNSNAKAVSADGSMIVGSATSSSGQQASTWLPPTVLDSLGDLPGGAFASEATAINVDGSVVVGSSIVGSGLTFEAFRWSSATGMVGLGEFAGGEYFSRALAVCASGDRVVGYSSSDLGEEAFIWTQQLGLVKLSELARRHRYLPGGWTLQAAQGISADGRTIVGRATNLSGNTEAFRIRFPVNLCPGDVNGDNLSSLTDLAALLGDGWNTAVGPSDPRDLDGDGRVGLSDVTIITTNWNRGCTTP